MNMTLQRFAGWLAQICDENSRACATFGGDFELKFRACVNSRRKFCANQPVIFEILIARAQKDINSMQVQ